MAFVGTADPERSRRFYEHALGLTLLERTPFACVYQAPNAQLRVAVVPQPAPAPYTVLGWRVDDISSLVTRLRSRGITTLRYDGLAQDELGIWDSPSGARVVWFRDPDGNVLSLTEA